MRRLLLAVLLIGLVGTAFGIHAQDATKHYMILAKGQGHGSTAALQSAVAGAGGDVTGVIDEIGVVTADSSNADFLAALKRNGAVSQAAEDVDVQWVSPTERSVEATGVVAAGVNSEPYWGYQWNIRQIKADKTAANGDMGEGAIVAVLDAGIWSTHPDIAPNLDLGLSKSFVPSEPGIDPIVAGFNHGTHTSGIIAAAINGKGVQGVAPKAKIVAIKVLASKTGSGDFSWLIQGLVYAASIHADVANMSLGATFDRINKGGGGAGPLLAALNRAINYATASGVLCVSAAGNEGVNLDSRLWAIPAQSGNGMAVSAVAPYAGTVADLPASYTNYGRSVVNVTAPGGDFLDDGYYPYEMVISPGSATGYYFAAGTSMAAPHVSGLAALIVGKYGHVGPAAIKSIIEKSSNDILKPGADPYSGKGRINAAKALGLE